jgi:hypothetical protein
LVFSETNPVTLDSSGSHLGAFLPPRKHLAISGDMFGCHGCVRCYLVGRGQGCSYTMQCTDGPQQMLLFREPAPGFAFMSPYLAGAKGMSLRDICILYFRSEQDFRPQAH